MSEDSSVSREIRIGEQTHIIPRFRGLKATIAGAMVSRVMRQVPEIQEEVINFRREYREKNTITITAAMAKLPRFAPLGLTEQDFAHAEGGRLEFPDEPTPGAVWVHVFPTLWDLADDELRRFFALIVISNRELEEADDADDVDAVLLKRGNSLLREGDIDELLELVVVGMEVLTDQMAKKGDRLGKLNQLSWFRRTTPTPPMPETEGELESDGPGETSQTPTETSPSERTNSEPNSSSPLPDALVGTDALSSTESPGVSSRS